MGVLPPNYKGEKKTMLSDNEIKEILKTDERIYNNRNKIQNKIINAGIIDSALGEAEYYLNNKSLLPPNYDDIPKVLNHIKKTFRKNIDFAEYRNTKIHDDSGGFGVGYTYVYTMFYILMNFENY